MAAAPPDSTVAIMPDDSEPMQPAAVRMFRHEARAAAAMNHPNVVQVYDVAMVAQRPCIVMEYANDRDSDNIPADS